MLTKEDFIKNYKKAASKKEKTYKTKTYYNNPKSVLQYDLNGNFIAEYDSIRMASAKTGISPQTISLQCIRKTSKPQKINYIFRFKRDE